MEETSERCDRNPSFYVLSLRGRDVGSLRRVLAPVSMQQPSAASLYLRGGDGTIIADGKPNHDR
jgi:hypothetical protein